MDIFQQYLQTKLPTGEQIGQQVTITTRTQQIEDEKPVFDDEGQPVFNEETNNTTAQIDIYKGNEKTVEGIKIKPGDATGYFLKKDLEYLNPDSYIDLEKDGINFHFKITDIIPDIVNIKVPLKRVE